MQNQEKFLIRFFLRQEKCVWDFPTFITNNRGQILNGFFSHVSFGFVIGYGLQQSGVFCFHLATFSIFLLQHLFDIGVLSFKGSLVSESFFLLWLHTPKNEHLFFNEFLENSNLEDFIYILTLANYQTGLLPKTCKNLTFLKIL